jgi:hypothetical protein
MIPDNPVPFGPRTCVGVNSSFAADATGNAAASLRNPGIMAGWQRPGVNTPAP